MARRFATLLVLVLFMVVVQSSRVGSQAVAADTGWTTVYIENSGIPSNVEGLGLGPWAVGKPGLLVPAYAMLEGPCCTIRSAEWDYLPADGFHWQMADAPPLSAAAIVPWRSGFVAVGRPDDASSSQGGSLANNSAAVAVSPDGITWQQAPFQRSLAYANVVGVAAGGPGLVAIGSVQRQVRLKPDGFTPAPLVWMTSPAVWTSIDGAVWTRLTLPYDMFGDANLQTITSGQGKLLILAQDELKGWVSSDGVHWQSFTLSGAAGPAGQFWGAAAGPHQFLIWRTEPRDATFQDHVWLSRDGLHWDSVSVPVALEGIVARGDGFRAIVGDDQGIELWGSPDGRSWMEIAGPDTFSLPFTSYDGSSHTMYARSGGIASIGAELVVIGVTGGACNSSSPFNPVAWVWTGGPSRGHTSPCP